MRGYQWRCNYGAHALSFILRQVVVVDAHDDDHQLIRAESHQRSVEHMRGYLWRCNYGARKR